jgi:ABC-type iron transport system FetAB permease component
MRINNQAKVGLVTVACLLLQGYVFTYILKVEPHPLLSIIPLIPYVAYIYARNGRTWYFNKPLYWIALIVALTALDILPFVLGAAS